MSYRKAAVSLSLLVLLVCLASRSQGSEPSTNARPNILWITSEDNSAAWMGCYGNPQAETPHVDRLAGEGVLYRHAYANAPVCAVARSMLLTGVHAVSQGTQHMRSRYPIPERFRPYVSYLREAGYYCTNNQKTDYNIRGADKSYWDASSRNAHYRNRPPRAPFFAIFNITTSHESSLFAAKTAQYRRAGRIPELARLAPSEVALPPLYPDLPAVRQDLATYYDVVTAMDRQVGALLDELSEAGLAGDTIVFYYSDHGGILPRSKRYLHDSGTNVPLVIRVPERFGALSAHKSGTETRELVSFVDFAPTVLSLARIDIPEHMQGRPFLGAARRDPDESQPVFLYADRFDETVRQHRAITDGRFRYVHNFSPHLPAASQNEYPYGIASWRAWRRRAEQQALEPRFAKFWSTPQAAAELFHTTQDPWEVNDLAANPTYAEKVQQMRDLLRQTMLRYHDLGMIPEAFWAELARDTSIHQYARDTSFPWSAVIDLAFQASQRDPDHLADFIARLEHLHPVIRYWAAYGCLILGDQAAAARLPLTALLDDPHAANRITAAHALHRISASPEALDILKTAALAPGNDPAATLAMHTLFQLEATGQLRAADLQRLRTTAANTNAARWARRILNSRR